MPPECYLPQHEAIDRPGAPAPGGRSPGARGLHGWGIGAGGARRHRQRLRLCGQLAGDRLPAVRRWRHVGSARSEPDHADLRTNGAALHRSLDLRAPGRGDVLQASSRPSDAVQGHHACTVRLDWRVRGRLRELLRRVWPGRLQPHNDRVDNDFNDFDHQPTGLWQQPPGGSRTVRRHGVRSAESDPRLQSGGDTGLPTRLSVLRHGDLQRVRVRRSLLPGQLLSSALRTEQRQQVPPGVFRLESVPKQRDLHRYRMSGTQLYHLGNLHRVTWRLLLGQSWHMLLPGPIRGRPDMSVTTRDPAHSQQSLPLIISRAGRAWPSRNSCDCRPRRATAGTSAGRSDEHHHHRLGW